MEDIPEDLKKLLKPEDPLLKIKEQWDSLNPKPGISFKDVKGDTGIEFTLRWTF